MVLSPPTSFVTGTTVASTFLNSEIARRAETPANYMVWFDGAKYYADSMTGGIDYSNSDAATTIQNAINAINTSSPQGGILHIRAGSYPIASPLTIGDYRIIIRGDGRRTTTLSGTTDVFKFTAQPVQCLFEHLLVTASAGHGFNIGSFGALNCKWQHLTLTVTGAGNSSFSKVTGAGAKGMFYNTFRDIVVTGDNANTTSSPFDLVSNVATSVNDGINQNIWNDVQIEVCGRAGIWIDEKSNTTYAFGNKFDNVSGDPCLGGLLHLNSASSTVIDACNIYDTVSPTAPMILLSKSSGLAPKGAIIRGIYSRAGTVSNPDIKLDGAFSGGGVLFEECNVGQLDFGAWASTTYIGEQSSVTTNFQNIPTSYQFISTDGTLNIAKLTRYGAIATAGLGLGAIYANYSTTGNTGAVSNAINYTPPATAGTYRLTAYVDVTAWTTPASFTVAFTYKDASGNARTDTMAMDKDTGTLQTAGAINSVDRFYGYPSLFSIDNSATAITLSTTGTFTGSPVYNLAAILEQVA